MGDSLSDIILEDLLCKYKAVYKMIASQPYGSMYADLASFLLNLPLHELHNIAQNLKIKSPGVWTLARLKQELESEFNKRLLLGLNEAIRLDSQRLLDVIDHNREPFVEGHPRRHAFDQKSHEGWSTFFHRWRQIFAQRRTLSNFNLEDLHSYVTELSNFYRSFCKFMEFIEEWPFPLDGVYPWYDDTFGRHLADFKTPDGRQLVHLGKFKKDDARNRIDTTMWQYQKIIELRTEFIEGLQQLCTVEMDDQFPWRSPADQTKYYEIIAGVLKPYRRTTEEIIENMKNLKIRASLKSFIRIEDKLAKVEEAAAKLGNESTACKKELRKVIGRYVANLHDSRMERLDSMKVNASKTFAAIRATPDNIVSSQTKKELVKRVEDFEKIYCLWENFNRTTNHDLLTHLDDVARVIYNWSAVEEYFNNVEKDIKDSIKRDSQVRRISSNVSAKVPN